MTIGQRINILIYSLVEGGQEKEPKGVLALQFGWRNPGLKGLDRGEVHSNHTVYHLSSWFKRLCLGKEPSLND